MAQKTQIMLVDDIDGAEADETVRFALDGVEYEIDLTTAHAEALRESFAEWVAHARRVGGRRTSGSRRRSNGGGSQASEAAKIRQWARENGYAVPDRGRIPSAVREAYEAAH